uniref:Uncharacterized protein n=1 Tax=Junco hyemalis TaxID=40217 RepID=A0A8C5JFU3_JUNHY
HSTSWLGGPSVSAPGRQVCHTSTFGLLQHQELRMELLQTLYQELIDEVHPERTWLFLYPTYYTQDSHLFHLLARGYIHPGKLIHPSWRGDLSFLERGSILLGMR